MGKGGRQGRGTEGSESWGWAGRGTQGRVGTVSGPPDCSVHLPPVCRKFLAAHPAERGRLWEVEPPGAWGQRDNIWLKVQLQQSRLHLDCEWGGAVPCGLIASRVGSDESAGETSSLCPRTRVLSGLIQRAVQSLSLCARLLPLRRDLRAHLCCSRCPDALPSRGGVRSRCLRGRTRSTTHPSGAPAFHPV